ncbi:unnamed protein product [Colias eurytheme]|nr:unnamed protein product [Colias eurytheme]
MFKVIPVCRNCVVSPTGSSPPPLQEQQSPPPPAPASPPHLPSPQPRLPSPQPHLPSPQPSHSGSSIPSTSNSPHPYSYPNFRRSQYQDYALPNLNQGPSYHSPQSPQSAMSLSPHPVQGSSGDCWSTQNV